MTTRTRAASAPPSAAYVSFTADIEQAKQQLRDVPDSFAKEGITTAKANSVAIKHSAFLLSGTFEATKANHEIAILKQSKIEHIETKQPPELEAEPMPQIPESSQWWFEAMIRDAVRVGSAYVSNAGTSVRGLIYGEQPAAAPPTTQQQDS